MKKSFWIVVIISILILIGIPVGFYFWKFHGRFSDDPSVWGAFGDYVNPFVAMMNVAAFVYLTYVLPPFFRTLDHIR